MKSVNLKSLTRIALIAAVAFTAATFANAVSTKTNSSEYQFTRVSGCSMLPTLNSGDVAVVYKAYPYKKLRVGDVVIVKSERGFSVIHRIVRRYRGGMWVTQGDNNNREDREVLTQDNFGGLALVDDSMARYQKYVAAIGGSEEGMMKVAFANTQNTGRAHARNS